MRPYGSDRAGGEGGAALPMPIPACVTATLTVPTARLSDSVSQSVRAGQADDGTSQILIPAQAKVFNAIIMLRLDGPHLPCLRALPQQYNCVLFPPQQ